MGVNAVEFDMGPAPSAGLTFVGGLGEAFGRLDAVLRGDFLHCLIAANIADQVVQAADVLVSEVDARELRVACVQLDR